MAPMAKSFCRWWLAMFIDWQRSSAENYGFFAAPQAVDQRSQINRSRFKQRQLSSVYTMR
jgi:hypothetical protein